MSVPVYAVDVKVQEVYSKETGFYRYYITDQSYVESNVRLGGIVSNAVILNTTSDIKLALYKNGKPTEINSEGYIYSDGEYTLIISKDDLTGKVNFVMDNSAYDNVDLTDEFYNAVTLKQSYDNKRSMYKLDMGNYYSFYASVPNNAMTNKGVKIYAPNNDDMTIIVEKNGEEVSFSSGQTFSDAGYYSVSFVYSSPNTPYDDEVNAITDEELAAVTDEEIENVQIDTPPKSNPLGAVADLARYSFYVSDKPQNRLNYINPPQDYSIASVTLNGKKTDIKADKCFKAEKDGIYKLTFKSDTMPDYSCTFERDTTPPTLKFINLGSGGKSKDNLEFIKNDKSSEVTITSNDIEYSFDNGIIDREGLYKIEVKDTAGNVNAYLVNVEKPLHINIFALIAVLIAVVAAVAMYVYYIKNNIRIR
jgi:hypothetical protein